jgi:type I restriction enzyme S subunit
MKPSRVVREKLRFVSEATYSERIARLRPEPGDVVFAREGTVGTALVIPPDLYPCLGQRVVLMRPNETITASYLELALNSPIVRRQYSSKILGTTSPHLNVRDVRQLRVPLPPLTEQIRIVAEAEDRISIADAADKTLTATLLRSAKLRRSILQIAFVGELFREPELAVQV